MTKNQRGGARPNAGRPSKPKAERATHQIRLLFNDEQIAALRERFGEKPGRGLKRWVLAGLDKDGHTV